MRCSYGVYLRCFHSETGSGNFHLYFKKRTVNKVVSYPSLFLKVSPGWTATQVPPWWRPPLPPPPPTRSGTSTGWMRAARSTRGRETWHPTCGRTSTWWNRGRGSPWSSRARSVGRTRPIHSHEVMFSTFITLTDNMLWSHCLNERVKCMKRLFLCIVSSFFLSITWWIRFIPQQPISCWILRTENSTVRRPVVCV